MPPNLGGGSLTSFLDRGLSDNGDKYISIHIIYIICSFIHVCVCRAV